MQITAIYEGGMLRPLEPLALDEGASVTLNVTPGVSELPNRGETNWRIVEEALVELALRGPVPSLEEIREMTSHDKTSWADTVSELRGEY